MRAAVRSRSRPFAQAVYLRGFRPTRANATEPERTPILAILATDSGAEAGLGELLCDPSRAGSDRSEVSAVLPIEVSDAMQRAEHVCLTHPPCGR
jgi:hypothetical protein